MPGPVCQLQLSYTQPTEPGAIKEDHSAVDAAPDPWPLIPYPTPMPRRRRRTPAPGEGERLTLRLESSVFGGASLAHAPDGRIVFVSFGIPGETVDVLVERPHADYLEAVVERVIDPSPDRVEPRCPLFGQCGGCQLQHMAYPGQLAAKEAVVREQLRRIGRLDDSVVRPIVGASDPWAYRNHMRFSTGKNYGDVGFITRHGRGLLKVEQCPIAVPWVNELLPALQGNAAGLHQVQVRHNHVTGSFLIQPAIAGLPVESGQRTYLESLGGHRFQVSSAAFFQVNTAQAEQMLRLVGEALPARGSLLVDAFAGVGTFAACFASRFERVVAIEESDSAAKDARVNIEGFRNIEMRVGKVEELLPSLEAAPDAVLLDPPRPGCHAHVLEAIATFRPAVVVYVSCNPATLARDLRILVDRGYHLDSVTPLDMFPQTGHIESVSRLSPAEAP